MSHHTDPGRFVITPPTPGQQRAAAITCADIALGVGAERDELAEVLAMLELDGGRRESQTCHSRRSTGALTASEASGVVGGAGEADRGSDRGAA